VSILLWKSVFQAAFQPYHYYIKILVCRIYTYARRSQMMMISDSRVTSQSFAAFCVGISGTSLADSSTGAAS
jgi:hypothetical protein